MLNLQRKGDTGRRLETVVEAEQEDEGYEHGKQNKAQNSNDQTFPSPLHWKTSRKRGSPSGSLHLPLNFLSFFSTAFFLLFFLCVFFWEGGFYFCYLIWWCSPFYLPFHEHISLQLQSHSNRICVASAVRSSYFSSKTKTNKHKSASFKPPLSSSDSRPSAQSKLIINASLFWVKRELLSIAVNLVACCLPLTDLFFHSVQWADLKILWCSC